MVLIINGRKRELAGPPEGVLNVAEVLRRLDVETAFVAVALNRECVRRRDYAVTPVAEGDEIEILSPQSGG